MQDLAGTFALDGFVPTAQIYPLRDKVYIIHVPKAKFLLFRIL